MKLASLHIICEYKKRAVAPGIRPSTSTLHYTLTTHGEKFLRTVENESHSFDNRDEPWLGTKISWHVFRKSL